MRLAPDTEVVGLLGIGSDTGTLGNARAALDVTASAVADKLGTPLEAASYLDFYSYIVPKFRRCFAPVMFRLSAGFVDPDSFVARISEDGCPISSAEGGEALTSDYYILDAEKGLVTLLKDIQQGYQVLCFSYDAGFVKEADTGVLQGTPDWLIRAGTAAAVKLVRTSPANVAKGKTSAYKDIQNALYGEVSGLINPHIRPKMGLVFPDRSVAEA